MITTRRAEPARWSDPGDLGERVQIRQEVTTADGYGGTSRTWSTLDTVWARVRPWLGAERVDDAGVRAVREYRVTIYRRADVTAAMRIVWSGLEMTIVDVPLPSARDMLMELRCIVGEVD